MSDHGCPLPKWFLGRWKNKIFICDCGAEWRTEWRYSWYERWWVWVRLERTSVR